MRRKTNYIAGLYIGTTKICCVLAQATDGQDIQILAIGQSESKGLRRGVVVNMEETVESIKAAVEEAESRAGFPIEAVHVGVSGDHIRGFNSRGVVPVRGKHGEIGSDDIKRVVEMIREHNPLAFYSVEDVRLVSEAVTPFRLPAASRWPRFPSRQRNKEP